MRGGSVDGNLILLDEAVFYNTSHLFGFFSVFNADVIKDLKLYKGGIPASFSGRTSLRAGYLSKEGTTKNITYLVELERFLADCVAERPIVKDKSSFVVAGRASYAHLFMKLADNANSVSFYDLNTKLNSPINEQ